MWVAHGFALFRAHPAAWLMIFPLVWLALLVLVVVPYVGPLVAFTLMPGFTAGMMNAAADSQHGRPPQPSALFVPLHARPREQLKLGFAYVAGLALVLMAVAVSLPADITPESVGKRPVQVAAMLPQLGVAALAYLPVMFAFWYAPAFVHWHGMKPAGALRSSLLAGVRNWRAFAVYGVVFLLLQLGLPWLISSLIRALLPEGSVREFILTLVLVPYGLVVACTFVCSYYSSYVAILPARDESGPAPP